MIVEMRTYTLALGATPKYLRLYEEKGLAAQKRILGQLLGFYQTEVGELNQIIHLWGYDSFEDRATRRKALWSDPEWLAYVKDIGGLVIKQENQLLLPAPFYTPQPAA